MRVYVNKDDKQVVALQNIAASLCHVEDLGGVAGVLESFLEVCPMTFEGRCLLRRIQMEQFELLSTGRALPLGERWLQLRLPMLIRKAENAMDENPEKAIQLAENILKINPYDERGNLILAQAANKLGQKKLVVLAYETICARKDQDVNYLLSLANAYIDDRDFDEAHATLGDLVDIEPDHEEIQQTMDRLQQVEKEPKPVTSSSGEGSSLQAKSELAPGVQADSRLPQKDDTQPVEYQLDDFFHPIEAVQDQLKAVCKIFESLANNAMNDASVLTKWQQWVQRQLNEEYFKLDAEVESNPTDPDSHFRLGLIRCALLRLVEARQAFNVLVSEEEHQLMGYSMMVLCAVHEEIFMKAAE